MKNKLIKLFVLFVTISVLTASKEETRSCKENQAVKIENSCSENSKDYGISISCKQATVVQANCADASLVTEMDNEISLSPISRFILLQ
ncbi:MAG: hypothetical protein ABIQ31_23625 [Ferruginibacter sp.]